MDVHTVVNRNLHVTSTQLSYAGASETAFALNRLSSYSRVASDEHLWPGTVEL